MDITRVVNTEITLIIFSAAKDGEVLYSHEKKKKLEADGDTDHELLIAKLNLN